MTPVLVFDLGGVLYDFQGDRLIAEHSRRKRRWRTEEVQARWPALARAFETGACSKEHFAEAIVQHFELELSPAQFLLAFRDAAAGFYQGALALLEQLRKDYSLVSLSNTNSVQWQKVLEDLEDLGAVDPFRAHHPSHLSGFHKPDPRAFQALAQSLPAGTPCLFFDDRVQNVRAASQLGWHARRVRGIGGAQEACFQLGLLG